MPSAYQPSQAKVVGGVAKMVALQLKGENQEPKEKGRQDERP